jgi:hypothetical protein
MFNVKFKQDIFTTHGHGQASIESVAAQLPLSVRTVCLDEGAWWIELSTDTQELVDVEDVDVLGVVSSTLAYLASEVRRIANLACYALINVPVLGPSRSACCRNDNSTAGFSYFEIAGQASKSSSEGKKMDEGQ